MDLKQKIKLWRRRYGGDQKEKTANTRGEVSDLQ
jgi:hypothetical protein